ncbi:hypothetical protein MMC32_000644 [Xylographa parallela]|nr:hypothetical protein [Xylographa parallela]
MSREPAPAKIAAANQNLSVRPAYLDYEPKPFLHTDSKNYCYRTYLDRLGFNIWDDPVALEARLQFIRDLKAHVCVPETTYLRKDDNPAAFNALIFGFFGRYGDRYWGMEREHLAEKDPLKGFLYPRDALRENSRLVSVLEDIFTYKAKCSRNNDWNRPLERQVVSRINFAALSPQDINSIGGESADTYIEGSLRDLESFRAQEMERTSGVLSPLGAIGSGEEDLNGPSPSLKVPNDSHRRSLVSHGVKRQDPSQAIEYIRKRVRTGPYPLTNATPPSVTTRNTRPKNTKKPSHGAPGLFTSSMTGNGGRRRNRRPAAGEHAHQDDTIIELSDEAESAEVIYQSSRNTGLTTPISNKSETKVKIKAEQLSSQIMSKTTLLVMATHLQDMAPVTVKLECFKGFANFLDFLAEECVLGNLSSKVTDVSATYTWNGRKHRFRKERLDVDWQAFCNELRDAFQKNPTFAQQGCEVGMLLHVAA